jgi:hypothetical protein
MLFSFRGNGTSLYPFVLHHNGDKIMDGWRFRIERLWLYDDVDMLHVKIDNLNDSLVGLCFIRSIDLSRHDNPILYLSIHIIFLFYKSKKRLV